MKMKDITNSMLAFVAAIVLIAAIVHSMDYIQKRQNRYEHEMQEHVLQMWGNGRDPGENHVCEYGDWCTAYYAKILEENNKSNKE